MLPCLSVRRSGRCWACWLDIIRLVGSADHAHLRCVVCLPGFLLAIAVVAVLGSGIANVIIQSPFFPSPRLPGWCAATRWCETANLYRVSTQYWCQRYDHLLRHILPGTVSSIVVFFTMRSVPRLSLPPACHFSASVRSRDTRVGSNAQ